MGLGALGELQMRSRRVNGQSYTSFLSLLPPFKYVTLGLAALDNGTVEWTVLKELHSISGDTIGPNEGRPLAFKTVFRKGKIKS